MRVISRKALKEASSRHPDLEGPLQTWYLIAKKAEWHSLEDIRRTYRSADRVGDCYVFNIKGNSYRLIVKIRGQRIYIKHVLTHAEYSKGNWTNECDAR